MGETNKPPVPFSDRWHLKALRLGFDDLRFDFVMAGETILPRNAAPCWSFAHATAMRRIWQVFGPANSWLEIDKARLEKYRVIGSDGTGNPFCIDTASSQVWLLDHEDQFRTCQFVNSDAAKLAECLLAFMGEIDAERFSATVLVIDQPAMRNGTFWHCEAALVGAATDLSGEYN